MNTSEENAVLRRMLKQAMPDDLPSALERRMQNRLAAFRGRCDMEALHPRTRMSAWIGRFSIRQRIAALASAGVATMLGFVLLWGDGTAQQASAMEKMAESIRRAKTFRAAVAVGIKAGSKSDTPPGACNGTLYWLAPESTRLDLRGKIPYEEPKDDKDKTEIWIAGKPWMVFLDHKARQFRKLEGQWLEQQANLGVVVEKLGSLSGRADRDLGVKNMNGKRVLGFEIDMKKILTMPNATLPNDRAEVWIDPESNLPLLVQFNYHTSLKPGTDVIFVRLHNFRWNIDLPPKLFDTTLPKGYTDVTAPDIVPCAPVPSGQIPAR
jgi:outer membrane lipoprotein-sorting protein